MSCLALHSSDVDARQARAEVFTLHLAQDLCLPGHLDMHLQAFMTLKVCSC